MENISSILESPDDLTPQHLAKLTQDLYEWISDPKNRWFNDWCQKNLIPESWLPALCSKSKKFNTVLELAKDRQNALLQKGAVAGSLNPQFVRWLIESDPHNKGKFKADDALNIAVLSTEYKNIRPPAVGEIGVWTPRPLV